MSEAQVREFAEEILPLLALHYRREALNKLESRSEWLKAFTSRQPDLEDARNQFFRDGSGCVHDLENHIELTRLARANEALTKSFSSFYSIFLAYVHSDVFFLPVTSKKYPTVREVSGKDAEMEEVRNKMIEVDQLERQYSRDFVHSFLVAEQANIESGRENEQDSM